MSETLPGHRFIPIKRMNESEWKRLVEAASRRELTSGEQHALRELLRQEPTLREKWETETRLNACLNRLPPAPVSSNFTSRVLQAIEQVEPEQRRWWERLPLPVGLGRPALGWACAVGVILFGGWFYVGQREAARARLATTVATMARGVSTPVRATEVPELWLDFDSIRLMGQAQPMADVELLAALK